MPYDPFKHHRRSIRLTGYDYRQSGVYFITLCTQNRACLFGEIIEQTMQLSEAGQIVKTHWERLPEHHPFLDLDEFVVMPNHFHGLLVIAESGNRTLGEIIGSFKTFSTRAIQKIRTLSGPMAWQRGYFERIVTSDGMLNAIRGYIEQNPLNWGQDPENRKGG